MTIEFQMPYQKVPEKLIGKIRNAMLNLSHLNKKVSKAEVCLKETTSDLEENQVCEIKLSMIGRNLFTHSRTNNFSKSADQAIKELEKRVLRKNYN